jgi:hypothetical protein
MDPSSKPLPPLGYTYDEPTALPDGQVRDAKSSSRLVMVLTAIVILGGWLLAVLCICGAYAVRLYRLAAGDPVPAVPSVPDLPWSLVALLLLAMLAKDKPLESIATIAQAIKR